MYKSLELDLLYTHVTGIEDKNQPTPNPNQPNATQLNFLYKALKKQH